MAYMMKFYREYTQSSCFSSFMAWEADTGHSCLVEEVTEGFAQIRMDINIGFSDEAPEVVRIPEGCTLQSIAFTTLKRISPVRVRAI